MINKEIIQGTKESSEKTTILEETNIKKLSREKLYDIIDSYSSNDWVSSPAFVELERRLNTFKFKQLKEEGYYIPNQFRKD